jgi:hypothetical protein
MSEQERRSTVTKKTRGRPRKLAPRADDAAQSSRSRSPAHGYAGDASDGEASGDEQPGTELEQHRTDATDSDDGVIRDGPQVEADEGGDVVDEAVPARRRARARASATPKDATLDRALSGLLDSIKERIHSWTPGGGSEPATAMGASLAPPRAPPTLALRLLHEILANLDNPPSPFSIHWQALTAAIDTSGLTGTGRFREPMPPAASERTLVEGLGEASRGAATATALAAAAHQLLPQAPASGWTAAQRGALTALSWLHPTISEVDAELIRTRAHVAVMQGRAMAIASETKDNRLLSAIDESGKRLKSVAKTTAHAAVATTAAAPPAITTSQATVPKNVKSPAGKNNKTEQCAYCSFKGHSIDVCRKRMKAIAEGAAKPP